MHTEQTHEAQATKPELLKLALPSVLIPQNLPQFRGTASPLAPLRRQKHCGGHRVPGVELLRFPSRAVFAEALSAALSCFNTSNTPHRSSRHGGRGSHCKGSVGCVSRTSNRRKEVAPHMDAPYSALTLALSPPHPKSFEAGASLGLTDAEEPNPCRNNVPLAAEDEVECLPSILKALDSYLELHGVIPTL